MHFLQSSNSLFTQSSVLRYCEDNAKIKFIKPYCNNCNKFEEACACQAAAIVPGCQPLVVCSTVASVQNTCANEFLAKLKPNVTELLTNKTSEQLAAPFFREGAQPQEHADTIKHIVSSTAATIFATVRFHVNMQKKTPSYGEVHASIFKAVLIKKTLPPTVTAPTRELCSEDGALSLNGRINLSPEANAAAPINQLLSERKNQPSCDTSPRDRQSNLTPI